MKELILSGFAIAFIAVGGFGINDFLDRNIDAVVHPQRVIPSKRLSGTTVLALSLIAFVGGIALSWILGPMSLVLGIIITVLLVIYSPLKNISGILGNITISLLLALTIGYGYASAGEVSLQLSLLLLAVAVFFASLSQELLKDVEDMDGDRGFRTTLPVQWGYKTAFRISAVLLLASLLLVVAVFTLDSHFIELAAVSPVLFYGSYMVVMLPYATPDQATRFVRILKIAFSAIIVMLVFIL